MWGFNNQENAISIPGGQNVTLAGSGNGYISQLITGSGNILMNGTGTWELDAGETNWTGNITVNSGTLEIGPNCFLQSYAGSQTITVNSGAKIQVNNWSYGAAGGFGNLWNGPSQCAVNGGTIEYVGSGSPGGTSQGIAIGTGGLTLLSSTPGVTWPWWDSTWPFNSANGITLGGVGNGIMYNAITGSGPVTKTGSGTWTFVAADNYSGNTVINSGTLALGSSGFIPNTPRISIASGATLDVSAQTSPLLLGSGQSIQTGANGTNPAGTVVLGAAAGLTLSSGGLSFSSYGGGGIAPLTLIGAGSLALNGTPVTLTTTVTLPVGAYTLIAAPGGARVSGTPGALTVNGSGTAAAATLSVSSGQLILIVGSPPGAANATLSLNQTNSTAIFYGVAGSYYVTQRSTNLTTAGWMSIGTNAAPANGLFQVIDSYLDLGGVPPGAAYYRLQPR
jgi:autotransporter-associated beta strand protein